MEKTVSATAELWRERIAAQQAGGQSIRALCKENGWHEHAFYWWRSRLGLSPASAIGHGRKPKIPAGFAEVVVDRPAPAVSLVEPPTVSAVEPIRLRLGAGRELVLPVSMRLDQVAELVGLLDARPLAIEGSR